MRTFVVALLCLVACGGDPPPGPATKLVFAPQPADVVAGEPFTLVIEAQDNNGNVDVTAPGSVMLSLAGNPSDTMLGGPRFASFVAGVATIPDSHVDVAGGYSVRAATDLLLLEATSDPFDVSWGLASAQTSSIVAVPHTLEANGIDITGVTLHVENEYSIAIPELPVTVTVSGTTNTLVPGNGVTDSSGDFRATISSTAAEDKDITGTDGQMTVATKASFRLAGCTPTLTTGTATGSSTASARLFDTGGDFDSNGRLDYVRYDVSGVSVLLTLANGNVVQGAPPASSPQEPYEAAAGDFTGDGHQDVSILKAAATGVTLEIAAGDGAGGLAPFTTQSIPSPYVTNMTPGNLNGDNKTDLVLFRRGYTDFSTTLSAGNSFGALQTYATQKIDAVLVRDVSGDNKPDVIVVFDAGTATGISVYRNNGSGGLMMPTSYGMFGLFGVAEIADMTSDGIVDLVLLDKEPTSARRTVLVYPGVGDGTFGSAIATPYVRLSQTLDFERLHVFDITGDGNADLVVHSNQGTAVIAGFGDGNVRQTSMLYALGYQGGAWVGGSPIDPVVVTDHDGDGRLDLVYWTAGLVVARNAACVQ